MGSSGPIGYREAVFMKAAAFFEESYMGGNTPKTGSVESWGDRTFWTFD